MKSFVLFINLLIIVISMVNAYTVIQNASGVYCDGYKCPENSASCIISQKTRKDLTKIDYVRQCLDGQGKVLDQFENTVNNPHPGSSFNSYVSSGGYSNIITSRNGFDGSDNYNSEEARKTAEDVKKQVDEVLKGVKQQEDYWTQWSKDFTYNLQKSLPKFN